MIIKVGLGRAQASVRLFHLFSKSQARARLNPNLFRKFSKPAKAREQSINPDSDPIPQYSGPTSPIKSAWNNNARKRTAQPSFLTSTTISG
jgi:hypothetical protein